MPRIYTGSSDPLDFCRRHFPSITVARKRYAEGEGPDGRGNCFSYDDDHPEYEGENYQCVVCKKMLTERDN